MAKENPSKQKLVVSVPGRNVYDLSHAVRFDTAQGYINLLTQFEMNPAERLSVRPTALIKTLPAIAPIFGRARCRIYAFWAPYHIYVPDMLTNGRIESTVLPSMPITTDYLQSLFSSSDSQSSLDNSIKSFEVRPFTLAEQSGYPAGFNPYRQFDPSVAVNGSDEYRLSYFAHLATWDIFRNYFADRSYPQFPVIRTSSSNGAFTTSVVSLDQIDQFYKERYYYDVVTDTFKVADFITFQSSVTYPMSFSLVHPPVKPYMPDILSAFVSNAAYAEAVAASIVRVANVDGQDGITMQSLLDGQRMYNFLAKQLATGGQLDEMVKAEFGVDISGDLDIPMFLRMWKFDLGFDDVIGTATDNLGELAGRGVGALGNEGSSYLNFSARHHGRVLFYMTIEPYVDYSTTVSPFNVKTNLSDLFWPSFDRIGWQPLTQWQINPNGGSTGSYPVGSETTLVYYGYSNRDKQVGVQAAYTEYKGMYNVSRGSFASGQSLDYWTFNRDFSTSGLSGTSTIFGVNTPYINPFAYNNAFADVSSNSMPFLCQVAFEATCKRVISMNQLEMF